MNQNNNTIDVKEFVEPTINDILKDENEVIIEDYYALARDTYDIFEENARNRGKGYECPSFPVFNQRLEGLEPGLYIFAGQSNSGKTAVMTNLAWAFAMHKPNKLFVVYYSLDDNTQEVIPRLISMNQKIPISVGSKPKRYEEYIEQHKNTELADEEAKCKEYSDYLEKRKKGLQELREKNKQFMILDRSKVKNIEQLIDHAKKVQIYVKSFDPCNNILVCIDSLADLVIDQKFSSDKERIDNISMRIKEAANCELNVPIFTSYHVRKLNHAGRPSLDDVKESSRIIYEASLCFLVYNDVSANKQAASVFYTTPEKNEKLPIIELDWAKNKKSSFKGRTYHYFSPNYSHVKEVGQEEMKRFDALVYSK